jgi:hypothetical protein
MEFLKMRNYNIDPNWKALRNNTHTEFTHMLENTEWNFLNKESLKKIPKWQYDF